MNLRNKSAAPSVGSILIRETSGRRIQHLSTVCVVAHFTLEVMYIRDKLIYYLLRLNCRDVTSHNVRKGFVFMFGLLPRQCCNCLSGDWREIDTAPQVTPGVFGTRSLIWWGHMFLVLQQYNITCTAVPE